jgi:anti-anti-sigma factor
MRLSVEPRDRYSILHLRGEFDTFYCPLLQKEIDSLVEAGVRHVVLNMRMVKFINSTALGAILRAAKSLQSGSGRLAIARPSKFSRDVMRKIGLERIVPVFESDEAAGEFVVSGGDLPEVDEGDVPEEDESAILFTLQDRERIEHFIPMEDRTSGPKNPVHGHSFGASWHGIGRMAGLDVEGLRFTWSGGRTRLSPFEMAQMLAIGTELDVKFRLPLFKPGHCEAMVVVDEVEERPDGVKIGASFAEIDDETRSAVQQYAEDMAFLKNELRSATGSR